MSSILPQAVNSARNDGVTMSAEEVARLPLIANLELHLEQLEERLA
jgi:hypothetical protein